MDVVKIGSGALFLNGVNTYSGATTISNGAFGGSGTIAGPGAVTLNAGTTLVPGASASSVGTLTVNSDLSIGGNLLINVNKSLAQSNSLVVVSGILTNTGTGTLTVTNSGPPIVIGDKFTLFSQAVSNGAAITVTGGRVGSWINNLAVDGSITAGVSAAPSPKLNVTINNTSTSMQVSWSDSFSTFKLQAQTNSVTKGVGANWADYPGGGVSPVTVPLVKTNQTVFFRLIIVSTP
jgi:autotransporter-associated beta strand protein